MGMVQTAEDISLNEDKISQSQEVGKLFQAARIEKGFTIEEVARKIHIRRLYIESIEEGDLQTLPGQVYAIGFIKSYARFLSLDGLELLRRLNFETTIKSSQEILNAALPFPPQEKPSRKLLLSSLLISSLLAYGWYVWIDGETQDVSSLTGQESALTTSWEPIPSNIEPVRREALTQDQTLEQISKPISTPVVDPLPMVSPETSSAGASQKTFPSIVNLEEHPQTSTISEESAIVVRALEDSWVQIVDSAHRPEYVRLMRAGETYQVPADKVLWLTTGNAGGIQIDIKGQSLPPLGEKGKVIRGIKLVASELHTSLSSQNALKSEGQIETSESVASLP